MGRRKVIEDEQVLRHAREVFLEGGAFGSTKEIARRAGISEATLFQRFPTKAALFLAALVPPEVDVEGIVHAPTKRADPKGALTEIGGRMLAYFRSLIPTVMQLMTHPSIRMSDVTGHFHETPEQVLAAALTTYLRDAEARGKMHVSNPLATANLLISAIHSLAVFELMEIHGGQDLEHAIEHFVEALWSGMAPDRRTGRKHTPRRKGTRKS